MRFTLKNKQIEFGGRNIHYSLSFSFFLLWVCAWGGWRGDANWQPLFILVFYLCVSQFSDFLNHNFSKITR